MRVEIPSLEKEELSFPSGLTGANLQEKAAVIGLGGTTAKDAKDTLMKKKLGIPTAVGVTDVKGS